MTNGGGLFKHFAQEVMTVARFTCTAVALLGIVLVSAAPAQEKQESKAAAAGTATVVSFKEDVFPLVKKYCLSCHAQKEENMSELSMDDYATMMQGGRHGGPVVPGKVDESVLVKKLRENPPFGQRMPLNSRKKIKEGKAKWLTDEEVRTFATWVEQGAKDN